MMKMPSFDFAGWTLNALRRLLYRWIRTNVFPEQLDLLKLRPDVPIVYVLHKRHLSNLLVLDHECRQLGLPPAFRTGPWPVSFRLHWRGFPPVP